MAAMADTKVETELVPLRVAASIAYFHITDAARQVSREKELAEIGHLVAIALSTVAPILRADGTALSETELRDLLYRPLGTAGGRRDLQAFFIRRGERRTAMGTLQEARVVFCTPH